MIVIVFQEDKDMIHILETLEKKRQQFCHEAHFSVVNVIVVFC